MSKYNFEIKEVSKDTALDMMERALFEVLPHPKEKRLRMEDLQLRHT